MKVTNQTATGSTIWVPEPRLSLALLQQLPLHKLVLQNVGRN